VLSKVESPSTPIQVAGVSGELDVALTVGTVHSASIPSKVSCHASRPDQFRLHASPRRLSKRCYPVRALADPALRRAQFFAPPCCL